MADFLKVQGVDGQRITAVGFGETMPVADNSTVEGRAQNRRVMFVILPNEKMRQDAIDQANE